MPSTWVATDIALLTENRVVNDAGKCSQCAVARGSVGRGISWEVLDLIGGGPAGGFVCWHNGECSVTAQPTNAGA